jgi:LacI family transcriptional regulator
MSKPKRATIDEVAERAEVSISTVSRVLNNLDRVHPDTRKRVQDAITALGYEPSAFARGLALQRTHTIGFITPNITDAFYSEMVRGVEDAAIAANYSMIVASQPAHNTERRFHQLFTQRRVDGLVLVGINVDRADLQQLIEQGFPIAVIQRDLGVPVPTFVVDNYGGARALAEHLVIDHGYRRIGYITGGSDSPGNTQRLNALRDVLREHGADIPPEYVVPGTFLRGSGDPAMRQLLDLPQPPEAVFAANDQMAADAISAARTRGLTPPHDIAIVGFDDIVLASYTTPPLTTVRQPSYEIGRRAFEAVLRALDDNMTPERVVLPASLVIRESCGCSPSARTS